jgi:hypothetical protein
MWFFGRGRKDEVDEETEDLGRLVMHAAELHGVSSKEVVDTVLDHDTGYEDDEYLDEELDEVPRKWWGPGVWITFVFVGGIFGLGIAGLIWLSHMATGPSASSGVTAFNASVAPKPLSNQTFLSPSLVFSYPGEFNTMSTEANWPNTTERYMIGSSGDYRRSISVMIESNAPMLTSDSGYQFRSEANSGYTPQNVTVSGSSAVVMVKGDNTERTLYWEHAGMLVVMSVVSTNGTDNVEQYMDTIVSSLRWRTTQ